MTRRPPRSWVAVVVGWAVFSVPAGARAQGGTDVERRGRLHGGARPPQGYFEMRARNPRAFEFAHGWLDRARAVRERRSTLRGRAAWLELNAPAALRAPSPSPSVVAGTVRLPTIVFAYSNVAAPAFADTASVRARFWGTAPAPPYSITTYYQEVSRGRLAVTGTVMPIVQLALIDSVYEGGRSGSGFCSGLCSNAKIIWMIDEAVTALDPVVDFGQYDNDGPDGVPNSDDDDGYVDAVVLLHPELGAECQLVNSSARSNIWAHRFWYGGWLGSLRHTNGRLTNDVRTRGGNIRVDDYIIQGVVGGGSGCTFGELAQIGTVTHETGHLFDLPDLYDTGPDDTEGVGEWDLMGSGNYQNADSPAHLSAWSRADLGWITEVPVTSARSVTLGPIESSDTAFVLPIAGTDEYFLLENRQPLGSDVNLNGAGLLIWHVDSVLVRTRRASNSLNAVMPHALKLEEADGLSNLFIRFGTVGNNRGDAGDPFPGSAGNTRFSANTSPPSAKNAGGFSGVQVDQITQLAPGGAMSFRVAMGGETVVRASDTSAVVRVDGQAANVYRNVFEDGSAHTIELDSAQFSSSGRSKYVFASWSDSGARSHTITGAFAGATYVATVQREHKVQASTAGTGSVTASRAIDLAAGAFLADGDTVTLTAVPAAGQAVLGWTGDTTATGAVLTLRVTRPFAVTANFQAQLVAFDTVLNRPVMGAPYVDSLRMIGGSGAYSFEVVSGGGTLPAGLSLSGTGIISGMPTTDSSYAFTVRVTSGQQTLDLPLRMVVTVPTLAVANVVAQLLSGGTSLSFDEVRYLDLLGNSNGLLDVGDFVAWLDATGAAVDAATMNRVLRRAGR